MPFRLSDRSLARLTGVHPLLVAVVKRAIELTDVDFGVNEGLRSVEQQKANVAKGVSQTMRSKHLTGHAVDLVAYVGGKIVWEPWSLYERINAAMQKAAAELRVVVTWGGTWKTLKDGPHFELDPAVYPMPRAATTGTAALTRPADTAPPPAPKPPVPSVLVEAKARQAEADAKPWWRLLLDGIANLFHRRDPT